MGSRILPRHPRLATRLGRASVVAFTMLAMPTTFFTSVASAQTAPDAKTSLANGEKAARAKDWTKALAEYEAANKATPSADALEGIANAHHQLKHDGEAYAAYDNWLKTYGASAPRPKKTAAEARLKELGDRTGALTLEVSEPGASITVDDKPAGTTPLASPLRLALGPHRVRITKDGFLPSDQVPNVVAGVGATVTVKLEAQTTKGRLSVKEKSGKAIRILVDGVDMGDAPWSGEVEAGPHDVSGRGGAFLAAPEKVMVERGKTRDVELTAGATSATLKVSTSDGKGLVYLDGKLVGEGTFAADVPAGQHALRITREGYDPFEEQVDLKDKETLSRSITLKLSSKIETGEVQKEKRALEGIYGGFGLLLTLSPEGMGHAMQNTCADKPAELTSCSGEGGALGGGLTGFVGYHWDPVGVELFMGAQYDQSSPTLTWGPSSTDPGIGPDPARTEEFAVRRVGGFGILRIRYTVQGEKLRFSIAGGVGLSYRSMLMTRDTTATANKDFREAYVPDAQSYLSPVISLEPSIQYRLSPKVSVALGMSLLVESPRTFDQVPTTPQEGGHHLGPSGLTTPQYELATGTQVMMGPFIGMMFGP
jgi:transcriptional regulator with XRE-family HTH domain